MVTQYGMSELGPIQYGRGNHQVFLGPRRCLKNAITRKVSRARSTLQVRSIIDKAYNNGRELLTANWDKVERMVKSLLEYETVDAEEVRAILENKPYDHTSRRLCRHGERRTAAAHSG